LAVIDVPPFDLDPLHERATVGMKTPFSFVVLYHVPGMQVGLAVRAGLDLVASFFDVVASLGVGEKTDISDNLAYLG
jgi:hypothetical protein